MSLEENINIAAQAISQADALLISAGLGMGTDSGLPRFNNEENYLESFEEWYKAGISYGLITDPQSFHDSPEKIWAFYWHCLQTYKDTTPHEGFRQMLEIANTKRGNYFVFTSNTDGLFQKAGFEETKIQETHGSMHHLQCAVPCSRNIWSADLLKIDVNYQTYKAVAPLPLCQNCGAVARPNILLFSDWYWNHHRTELQSTRMGRWIQGVHELGQKLVILEIGAGNSVADIRAKSSFLAEWYNVTLVRINPKDNNVPPGHIPIALGAKEGIDLIYKAWKTE